VWRKCENGEWYNDFGGNMVPCQWCNQTGKGPCSTCRKSEFEAVARAIEDHFNGMNGSVSSMETDVRNAVIVQQQNEEAERLRSADRQAEELRHM
jgi:hypothetical protein